MFIPSLLLQICFTTLLSTSNGFSMPSTASKIKSLQRILLYSSTSEQITSPPILPKLKNNYYLLRHGQSTSNVAGRISSSRTLAYSSKHGLTNLGYEQGKASAKKLVNLLEPGQRVVFYSSPFARAKETAFACLDGLKELNNEGLEFEDHVTLEDGLMERFFGRLDNEKLETYNYVWPIDMYDPSHKAFDVESVHEVIERIHATLLKIDAKHESENIVLVSHADVLQITQVYAAGLENVGRFSEFRFGNGEVRIMGRDVNGLPEAKPLKTVEKGN